MREQSKARKSKGQVTIGKGFQLWREVVTELFDYHGMDVTATVTWSDDLHQLVVSRLDIHQPEGGAPITAEAIRHIAVHQIVRRSLTVSVTDGLMPGSIVELGQERAAFGLISKEQVGRCRVAGPVPETLEWVARLYRAALAIGDPPTKTVREVFGLSSSTAGAWVGAARKQGYLGESEGPGKAGG